MSTWRHNEFVSSPCDFSLRPDSPSAACGSSRWMLFSRLSYICRRMFGFLQTFMTSWAFMAPSAGFPERGIPEETNRQRDVSSFTTLRFIAAQTETTHPCCRDYKTNPIQTGGSRQTRLVLSTDTLDPLKFESTSSIIIFSIDHLLDVSLVWRLIHLVEINRLCH